MDRWTLMEQSLADRSDAEEVVDTKLGGVHSMDNQLQLSLCCKFLNLERINAHTWNNV